MSVAFDESRHYKPTFQVYDFRILSAGEFPKLCLCTYSCYTIMAHSKAFDAGICCVDSVHVAVKEKRDVRISGTGKTFIVGSAP